MSDTTLREEFHVAMQNLCRQMRIDKVHEPTRLEAKLRRHNGVTVAKRIIRANSYAFDVLYRARRLDLAIEVLVLDPKWRRIFNEEHIRLARERLSYYCNFDFESYYRTRISE